MPAASDSTASALSPTELLVAYSDRMKAGDFEAVYDYFWPSFYSHGIARVAPNAPREMHIELEKRFWMDSAVAFPDRKIEIEVQVSEGQIVASNWTFSGTHSGGLYLGMEPNGAAVTINGTGIVRFENGRVIEHWGGPHCARGIGL